MGFLDKLKGKATTPSTSTATRSRAASTRRPTRSTRRPAASTPTRSSRAAPRPRTRSTSWTARTTTSSDPRESHERRHSPPHHRRPTRRSTRTEPAADRTGPTPPDPVEPFPDDPSTPHAPDRSRTPAGCRRRAPQVPDRLTRPPPPRPRVGGMHQRFVVVPASYVFLLRDGDGGTEVLLQLRQNTGYMDDHWAAAAAGHVEKGETAYDAAHREAAEELGVHDLDLEFVTSMQRTRSDRPIDERIDFFFTARSWTGEPTHRRAGQVRRAAVVPDSTSCPTPWCRTSGRCSRDCARAASRRTRRSASPRERRAPDDDEEEHDVNDNLGPSPTPRSSRRSATRAARTPSPTRRSTARSRTSRPSRTWTRTTTRPSRTPRPTRSRSPRTPTPRRPRTARRAPRRTPHERQRPDGRTSATPHPNADAPRAWPAAWA